MSTSLPKSNMNAHAPADSLESKNKRSPSKSKKLQPTEQLFAINTQYVWTNRQIQIRQCIGVNNNGSLLQSYQEFVQNNHRLYSRAENGNQRIQIRFLTQKQIEHILLSEIKKWEPYIEEEKNQLKLVFTLDEELSVACSNMKTYIANLQIIESLDPEGEVTQPEPSITNQNEIHFLNENFVCVSQNCQKFMVTFECPVANCHKQFQKSSKLRQHLKSHLTVRFHKCTYPGCTKSFKMPQHLSYHVTTHEKEKNKKFVCSYPGCFSEFRQHWILRDHEKTHQNVYKFQCTYEGCDKKYNTRSNFDVHMRKHEGLRPFVCNYCGKKYISKWNMAKHQKKGCPMQSVKKAQSEAESKSNLGKRESQSQIQEEPIPQKVQKVEETEVKYKPRILVKNNSIAKSTMLKLLSPNSKNVEELPLGLKRNIASASGFNKQVATFENVKIKQSCTPDGMNTSAKIIPATSVSMGEKSKPGESNLSEQIKIQQQKLQMMQEKLMKKKQLKVSQQKMEQRDLNMSFAGETLFKPQEVASDDAKKISDSATFPNNITPSQNNVYLTLQPQPIKKQQVYVQQQQQQEKQQQYIYTYPTLLFQKNQQDLTSYYKQQNMQLLKPIPMSVITPGGLIDQPMRFSQSVLLQQTPGQTQQSEYKPRLQLFQQQQQNSNYFMQIKEKDTPSVTLKPQANYFPTSQKPMQYYSKRILQYRGQISQEGSRNPSPAGNVVEEMTPGGIAATTLNGLPHYASYNKNLMTPLGITISPMGQAEQPSGLFYNVQQQQGDSPTDKEKTK